MTREATKNVEKNQARPGYRVFLGLSVVALLLALAAGWAWSPMRDWLDLDRMVLALRGLGMDYGPVVAVCVFAAALTMVVPLTFLTVVTVVAFGPFAGFIYSMVGAQLGASLSYGLGVLLGREGVRKWGGTTVNAVSQRLAERGLIAIVAIRLVPVAPFAVVNMAAGASHIRFSDLLLGTLIGMMPGTLVIAFFVEKIIESLRGSSAVSGWIVALAVLLVALGGWGARYWLRNPRRAIK